MQQEIMLGCPLHCTDGQCGSVSGLVFNPNRSHLDYLVIHADAHGGRDQYVPIGYISAADPQAIKLRVSSTDLARWPLLESPETVHAIRSNLPDLCVADEQTTVRDTEGKVLGRFRGAILDSDYQVVQMLLAEGEADSIPVAQLAPCEEHTLTVQFADQVGA